MACAMGVLLSEVETGLDDAGPPTSLRVVEAGACCAVFSAPPGAPAPGRFVVVPLMLKFYRGEVRGTAHAEILPRRGSTCAMGGAAARVALISCASVQPASEMRGT